MPPFFWSQKQDIGPTPEPAMRWPSTPPARRSSCSAGSRVTALSTTPGRGMARCGRSRPTRVHRRASGTPWPSTPLAVGRPLRRPCPGRDPLDDTWVWDGRLWTQVADTGPSARSGHAMAFDVAAGQVVLFGGIAGAPLGDTWTWDGAVWTQVQDVGPSARSGHAMAAITDPQRRALLYGGFGADGMGLADTWAWDGTAWTEIQDMGPGPRIGATLTGVGAGAILFGGVIPSPPDRRTATSRATPGDGTRGRGPSPRTSGRAALRSFDGDGRRWFAGGDLRRFVVAGRRAGPGCRDDAARDTWEAAVEAGAVPASQRPAAGSRWHPCRSAGDNHLYRECQLAGRRDVHGHPAA